MSIDDSIKEIREYREHQEQQEFEKEKQQEKKDKVINILNKYFKTLVINSHYEAFSELVYEELEREGLLK